jgi:hypothetical protein
MTAVKKSGLFASDSRLSYPVTDWEQKKDLAFAPSGPRGAQLEDTTFHGKNPQL